MRCPRKRALFRGPLQRFSRHIRKNWRSYSLSFRCVRAIGRFHRNRSAPGITGACLFISLCAGWCIAGDNSDGDASAGHGIHSSDGISALAPDPAHAGSGSATTLVVSTTDQLARDLRKAGDTGRGVTVVGAVRSVGTTYAAIMLARALSQTANVVLADLHLAHPIWR